MTASDLNTSERTEDRPVSTISGYKLAATNRRDAWSDLISGFRKRRATLLSTFIVVPLVAALVGALTLKSVAGNVLLVAAGGMVATFLLLQRRSSRSAFRKVVDASGFPTVPLEEVFLGLAAVAEVRDTELRGHCNRVAENSAAVGSALGLSDQEVQALYWGGLLHDLGKVVVAASTLEKADRLTEAELAEIRRHPDYGADLVASVAPAEVLISEAIRYHHERWDGLGYPSGLKRDEIPMAARIIAVVDVFEALTSKRPYRHPLRPDQALVYVRRCSGTHFDPIVVTAFERLYDAGALKIADETRVAEDGIARSAPWKAVLRGAAAGAHDSATIE